MESSRYTGTQVAVETVPLSGQIGAEEGLRRPVGQQDDGDNMLGYTRNNRHHSRSNEIKTNSKYYGKLLKQLNENLTNERPNLAMMTMQRCTHLCVVTMTKFNSLS